MRDITGRVNISRLHDYHWRLGLTDGESKHDDLEKRLALGPVITVPTITLDTFEIEFLDRNGGKEMTEFRRLL